MAAPPGASVKTSTVREAVLREAGADKNKVLKIDRVGANQGDTIRWEVGNRLVSIWFPESGVFVSPVLAVKHMGVVEATIPDDAEDGVYEYCIYCHDTGEFVVCESHPKLEIPKP